MQPYLNMGPAYKQVDRYSVETEVRRAPEERAPEAYFCRLRSAETRPPVSRWYRRNSADLFIRGPLGPAYEQVDRYSVETEGSLWP